MPRDVLWRLENSRNWDIRFNREQIAAWRLRSAQCRRPCSYSCTRQEFCFLFLVLSRLPSSCLLLFVICSWRESWTRSNQVPSCDRWEPKRRRRTTAADGAFLVRRRLCSHFWESCSGAAPRCRTRRCSAADTTQVMAVWRLGGLFCVGEGSENRPFRIWDPRPRLKAEPTGRKSGRVYIQTLPLRKDKWWFFFPLPCIDKDKSW